MTINLFKEKFLYLHTPNKVLWITYRDSVKYFHCDTGFNGGARVFVYIEEKVLDRLLKIVETNFMFYPKLDIDIYLPKVLNPKTKLRKMFLLF